MRPSGVSSALALITTFLPSTLALQAISSSPCAAKCGNVLSETNGEADIACLDGEYATTSKGAVFKECITCQLGSKYVEPVTKQTDLQWAIYNLRYAVSWCVFGYPNNTNHASTPCMTRTSCGALENAFEFDSLSPGAAAYGYCSLLHTNQITPCTSCVGNSEGAYITNFVTALSAACQQQPIAGSTITLDGTLFSSTHVNITDPNAAAADSTHRKEHGLSLGAKVGVAIGALVAILIITGCAIVWSGKRKRRAQIARRQRESGYHEWVSHHVTQQRSPMTMGFPPHARSPSFGFHDSPQSAFSQKPLFPAAAWSNGRMEDDSSPGGEKVFSPYTSNYSSPVSASDQVQVVGREWPIDRAGGFAGALGQPTVRSRSREKREAAGDKIEMQNVAPVLLHPGNGRRSREGI